MLKPRAKDVLQNTNRMQAAEITPSSDGMVPSAAAWRHLQQARSIPSLPGVMGVRSAFLSMVTLTFDLHIQTHQSEKTCLVLARDQTRLPYEFGTNPFPRYMTDKQTKKTKNLSDTVLKKETLLACGNDKDLSATGFMRVTEYCNWYV